MNLVQMARKGSDVTEAAEQNLAVAQSYRGLEAINAVTHY